MYVYTREDIANRFATLGRFTTLTAKNYFILPGFAVFRATEVEHVSG